MSKSNRVFIVIALVVCMQMAGGAQLRRILRSGGPPTEPSIPSGSGNFPNEPAGFSILNDWNLSGDAPIGGDVSIPGSGGWKMVYNTAPDADGWIEQQSDATGPVSPSTTYAFHFPLGKVQGAGVGKPYLTFPAEKRAVYVGQYIKWSTPFDVTAPGHKVGYIWDQRAAGAYGQYFMLLDSSYHLWVYSQRIQWEGWLVCNINCTAVTLNAWHLIEWYSNADTGRQWWRLDGVMQGDHTSATNIASPPPFGGYVQYEIDPVWGGCCTTTKAEHDVMQWDHIRISTP